MADEPLVVDVCAGFVFLLRRSGSSLCMFSRAFDEDPLQLYGEREANTVLWERFFFLLMKMTRLLQFASVSSKDVSFVEYMNGEEGRG